MCSRGSGIYDREAEDLEEGREGFKGVIPYIYDFSSDKPLRALAKSHEAEHFLLIPNTLALCREAWREVFKKYYLSEMFDLSNFVLGTYKEPYMFLHLVNHPLNNFKVSIFDERYLNA